jgi:hypothetical protein
MNSGENEKGGWRDDYEPNCVTTIDVLLRHTLLRSVILII